MESNWKELLNRLGIAYSFTDAAHQYQPHTVSDETLLKMVNCLGFQLKSVNDSDKILQKIENKR